MSSKATYRALLDLAAGQGGYFTAGQALSVGYTYPAQHYHVAHDNWRRMAHGVYQLRDYPTSPHGHLIVLTLLSMDRAGRPQAVMSHETALTLHDLGDANPAHIHLTVPPGFRGQLEAGIIVHRGQVTEQDWQDWGGFRVTTPLRTLLDIAADETSWPQLDQAVQDTLRLGLVRRAQLLETTGSAAGRERLAGAVAQAMRTPTPRQEVGIV